MAKDYCNEFQPIKKPVLVTIMDTHTNSKILPVKIILLLIAGVFCLFFVFVFSYMAYASSVSSHQNFAYSYPVQEPDLRSEGIRINISDSDFIRHPILENLVQDPAGGRNIKFDREEYRDPGQIEDFRNKYSSNRSITRYVQWNDTYYQIIIGQE